MKRATNKYQLPGIPAFANFAILQDLSSQLCLRGTLYSYWHALTELLIYYYTLPAKSMEYSENTMVTLAFDILIYCEWLEINHK